MSTKTFNLNNYEVVKNEEEASIKLVPFKMKDGSQPAPILLKRVGLVRNYVNYDDVVSGDAEWYPNVAIDIKGTPREYEALVCWWFDEATEEFKQTLATNYRNVPNLRKEIEALKRWLIDNCRKINGNGKYVDRRPNIKSYLSKCLNKKKIFDV